MAIFVAIPLFVILVILQGGVVSTMPLLHGTADVVLLVIVAWALQERVQTAWQWCVIGGLMVSLVSGMLFGVILAAYLAITGIAIFLRQRVWKVPVLAMLVATLIGTALVHVASYLVRSITGAEMPLLTSFEQVTLPSMLLNLLLSIPVYVLIRDLATWLYPEEIEA